MAALQAEEACPLSMGKVQPGTSCLATECGLFRAAAFAHAAPTSDFLLVRHICLTHTLNQALPACLSRRDGPALSSMPLQHLQRLLHRSSPENQASKCLNI